MVNRLYLKKDVRLLNDFQRISKEIYDSELLEADFKNNSKQLVEEINEWIELETNNKIQDAIKEINVEVAILPGIC